MSSPHRLLGKIVVLSMLVAIGGNSGSANAAPRIGNFCSIAVGAIGGVGAQNGVQTSGQCGARNTANSTGGASGPAAITKTIVCGRTVSAFTDVALSWNPICGQPTRCQILPPAVATAIETNVSAVLQQDPATKQWRLLYQFCPAAADAIPDALPDPAAIKEQAVRLLPKVAIRGSSVPTTLVNIETITWADTPPKRPLGPVVVVGHKVWISIVFDHASWNYGDGNTETRTSPGAAYPARGTCYTKLCADYDGHVYTTDGWRTTTLTVTWTASFSLDGENYQPIGGAPITGPATALAFHVRSARTVLVDTPH